MTDLPGSIIGKSYSMLVRTAAIRVIGFLSTSLFSNWAEGIITSNNGMLEVARWWICLRYQTVILHYSLLFRVVNPLTVDLRLFTTICYHQMSRVKLHEVRMQAWLCTLYLTLCSLSVSDQGVLPNCSLITPWMLRARTILLWVQSRLLREPKSGTELDQKRKGRPRSFPRNVGLV